MSKLALAYIAPSTSFGYGHHLAGKNIMVVDDEVEVAGLVEEMLSGYGARVQTAHTGAEAFARLRAGSFDLVVCDQNLPDLSGPSLYALLSGGAVTRQRFVFITGANVPASSLAMEDGVCVLRKPFRRKDLVATVDRLLGVAEVHS